MELELCVCPSTNEIGNADDYTMLSIWLDAVEASHLSFHPISIPFFGFSIQISHVFFILFDQNHFRNAGKLSWP